MYCAFELIHINIIYIYNEVLNQFIENQGNKSKLESQKKLGIVKPSV